MHYSGSSFASTGTPTPISPDFYNLQRYVSPHLPSAHANTLKPMGYSYTNGSCAPPVHAAHYNFGLPNLNCWRMDCRCWCELASHQKSSNTKQNSRIRNYSHYHTCARDGDDTRVHRVPDRNYLAITKQSDSWSAKRSKDSYWSRDTLSSARRHDNSLLHLPAKKGNKKIKPHELLGSSAECRCYQARASFRF